MLAQYLFRAKYESLIHDEIRTLTKHSTYSINATLEEAPKMFNCLTFMSWFFQIFHLTVEPLCEIAENGKEVELKDATIGDLIFTAGKRGYYMSLHGQIGHVGIVTPHNTIIHATRRKNVNGVIEESLEEFLIHHGPFRTARRLIE